MKKKKITTKTKKKIFTWLFPACTILSLLLAFYMAVVSPTKKDIRRIESLVKAGAGQTQATTPIWIPEGSKKINDAELEKLEKDIRKVESSIFFSLSSETYLDIAVFYFDQTIFNKALEYVDKSIRKAPLNPKSLLLRSILRFYAGLFPAALADTNVILASSRDDKPRAAAQTLKGFISLLGGDPQTSKDSLIKAADFFLFPTESKELLLLSYCFISSACFDLGEYDTGDYYYSRAKDIAKQLEALENKNPFTIIILALVNLEGDFKTILDNYDKLVKLNDESVFGKLFLYLYRAAISIDDFEAFTSYLENAIQLCNKYEIVYLQQLLKEQLFESWLDYKKSFRKDLWEEILTSPAKIPAIDADMYLAAGKFYHQEKDNESALNCLNVALERYTTSSNKKYIIETKISIYFAQSDLRDYFSAAKILRSALEDINGLLRQNSRRFYLSKRAKEEVDQIRAYKEDIERLLPIIDKLLR